MTNQTDQLPPEMLASLLRTVRRKQEQGEAESARAVLHALAAQQPNEPRIWLALATAAATRSEQRAALERALELDPQNALARRALERFTAGNNVPPAVPRSAPVTRPLVAHVVEPQPAQAEVLDSDEELALDDEAVRGIRWPLYLVIGVAVVLVLLVALLLRPDASTTSTRASTPALPDGSPLAGGESSAMPGSPGAQLAPTTVIDLPILGSGSAGAPTLDAAATAVAVGALEPTGDIAAATPQGARAPTAAATAGAVVTPPPELAPGQVVELPPWSVSLLRPDYAMALDGAIGPLQPQGRFVLALVVAGNDGPAPARIPAALFTLQDQQGNRYTPVPNASTVYLDTYGRGQRGELSLEEELPPGGGLVSVPLIFDVPLNARGLMLHAGDQDAGWPIGGAPASGAAP
jgi:hypothetical protein